MKKIAVFLILGLLCLTCKGPVNDSVVTEDRPPTRAEGATKIAVLHQVNGEYVRGLRVSVYESGSTQAVFEDEARFGFVYPKLEVGKTYDIAVRGNEDYASSFVKNLKIKTSSDDVAVIALVKAQKTRKATFLELTEFKYREGSENKDVSDGFVLKTPIKGKFIAKIVSASGAVYNSMSYGFSARLGVGIVPYSFAGLNSKGDIDGVIKTYPSYEDGRWNGEFLFNCDGGVWESFTNDEQDLVAVFYDSTGNRLEAHNYVKLEPKRDTFTEYQGDKFKVKDFHVETRIYSSYNQMFSVSPETFEPASPKRDVHYAPNVYFTLSEKGTAPQKHPDMLGVEVFRREAGEMEFKKIVTRVYRNKEEVRENNTYLGSYVLDNTGTFEVGKEYEYKARIYIPSGHYLDSGVAKIKILPQCKAYLYSPHHNKSIEIEGGHASFDNTLKEFQVQLSERSLWDAQNSDYFTIGLSIRQFNDKEMYKMLLRYHFDYKDSGKPEIEFVAKQNGVTIIATSEELKQLGLLPYYVTVNSLVEYDSLSSIVTLKKDLLEARCLNVSSRWDTFKDGEIYYWDVFGANSDLLDAVNEKGRTKVPPSFTKEYKGENGISYARTFGSGLSLASTSSENGRFAFTIKSKKMSAYSSPVPYKRPSKMHIIEGSYIVKASDVLEDELKALGASVHGKIEGEEGFSWYCVRSDEKNKDILHSLLSIDGVVSADYEHEMILPKNERVGVYVSPYGLSGLKTFAFNDSVTLGSCYSLEITKALKAYEEVGFGDEVVLCGIVDSGISLGHEDLKGLDGRSIVKDFFIQNLVKQGDNLTFQGWKKSTDVGGDPAGHGSHCVGIMAACGNNKKGITGVSWKNTEVVVYRGLEDPVHKGFTEFASCDGIRQFTNYVKELRKKGKITQACVPLNLSFGTTSPSPLMFEVIEDALENGVLPVVAMANDGLQLPFYPASYTGTLAVGSSNGNDNISSYSNKGAWISVVAPGENIMSLDAKNDGGYVCWNGTSMAAPFVTGMVAYLVGLNRELTPYQIKDIIEKTADKIGTPEEFNTERGYGRVNVYQAAKLAKRTGAASTTPKYNSSALRVQVHPKLRAEDGGGSFSFETYVPYVFLYDANGVCVAGGYLVANDPSSQNKKNMNIALFRGLRRGKYVCKVHSYVYSEWPKVYRLVAEETVDFRGDEDLLVEFTDYTVVKK